METTGFSQEMSRGCPEPARAPGVKRRLLHPLRRVRENPYMAVEHLQETAAHCNLSLVPVGPVREHAISQLCMQVTIEEVMDKGGT
jgi:hypothetical protein